MKELPLEFAALWAAAEALLASDSAAEQAVLLRTAGDALPRLANHSVLSGGTAEEDAFVQSLVDSQDTEIRYLLCLWRDGTPDVPSRHLQLLLRKLHPSNETARLLLRSSGGFVVKELNAI
ncbi:MAG: hypothetical protein ACI4PC_05065 [Oscillospiraceae bacterium]